MIYLLSDMEDLAYDPNASTIGIVIEADLDKKKGIAATLIVDNGILEKRFFHCYRNRLRASSHP